MIHEWSIWKNQVFFQFHHSFISSFMLLQTSATLFVTSDHKAYKLTRWCLHLTAIYRNVPIIWYSPDYPTSSAWSSVSARADHSQSEASIMHTDQSEASIMHTDQSEAYVQGKGDGLDPHYADRFIRLGNFLLVNHESNGPKLGRWREESSVELMRKEIYLNSTLKQAWAVIGEKLFGYLISGPSHPEAQVVWAPSIPRNCDCM